MKVRDRITLMLDAMNRGHEYVLFEDESIVMLAGQLRDGTYYYEIREEGRLVEINPATQNEMRFALLGVK